jgi:hypothetical protein
MYAEREGEELSQRNGCGRVGGVIGPVWRFAILNYVELKGEKKRKTAGRRKWRERTRRRRNVYLDKK